ncbi:MAG: hypothetical protein ABIO70_29210 [Pseudomonadota bacterium]
MRLVLLAFLAVGCRVYSNSGGVQLPDTGEEPTCGDDTGGPDTDDTGEADPVWDGAVLQMIAPESGDFLPMEDAGHFEAQVADADGNVLDWDDIAWTSSEDSDWNPVGASFDDASLRVGRHDITAQTRLPNGDRLAWTVGDVLVQSAYAGTYTGNIYVEITIEYNGTPITVSCAGATTIVVDLEGQTILGDSTCLVSLMGYDMNLALTVDATNDHGDVEGDVAVDAGFFDVPIASTGSLTEDGELSMEFADDVYGYAAVAGSVEATRISRDTELGG